MRFELGLLCKIKKSDKGDLKDFPVPNQAYFWGNFQNAFSFFDIDIVKIQTAAQSRRVKSNKYFSDRL